MLRDRCVQVLVSVLRGVRRGLLLRSSPATALALVAAGNHCGLCDVSVVTPTPRLNGLRDDDCEVMLTLVASFVLAEDTRTWNVCVLLSRGEVNSKEPVFCN